MFLNKIKYLASNKAPGNDTISILLTEKKNKQKKQNKNNNNNNNNNKNKYSAYLQKTNKQSVKNFF